MSLYPPPRDVATEIWSSMPDELRITNRASAWAEANKPGQPVDSFLKGPSFDRDGNLWVVDIPWGRIFKISPSKEWTLVTEYEGWPNGLKIHRDGRVFIADYRRGILVLNPDRREVEPLLSHRYSESFHGCNDLFFASNGDLYFTDQGQSGLHQPDGRVYRLSTDGRLECLIANAPSPNGLVMNESETILYVAMTRGNAIWRLPLMLDGGVSKVGLFIQLSGGLGGPGGLALDAEGGVVIAHAGNATVWVFSRMGEPLYRARCTEGDAITNIAYGGEGNRDLFICDSTCGHILRARLDVPGQTMFAHL